MFHRDRSTKDGLQAKCKDCSRIAQGEWRRNNPDKKAAAHERYRAKYPNYWKEYEQNNKEKRLEKDRVYREKNHDLILARRKADRLAGPGKHGAYYSKYRAKKKQSNVAWANNSVISDFYWWASEISRVSGEIHHVDHIVPLDSKLVCGLHHEDNLQILLGKDNQSKGNLWWPGMNGFSEYVNSPI